MDATVKRSLAGFYAKKKVLLTGHTGFKGSWLVAWLRHLGSDVVGLALAPEREPNLFMAAEIGSGMISILGDVRDFDKVNETMRSHSPEIVIHNAAQALVRRSYQEPVATYSTNVMGTAHVLEAARNTSSVRAIVVVTTDKCYENCESGQSYVETDRLGGNDPYSSSKAAAELVVAAYRASFFSGAGAAAVASVRAGNVIGGGDWSVDRLVPDIVRGICSNRPIVIRRPGSIRPWQHVLEPLRGYLLLAQKLYECGHDYAEAWNFGPPEEDAIEVSELAKHLTQAWGKGELQVEQPSTELHEARFLRLNSEKARQRLGWHPLLSLDQALDWTVRWYHEYYEQPRCARRITTNQIEAYMRAGGV